MGKGSNDKKARLLFEEWDSALNGSLLETQVNDMVDVLVRIAIDVIPNACAVSPDLEATTSVSRSKLVTFIDQIGGVQNTVK
ncbi:MAG: hypothetical protein V2I33_22040 [Kangiellaceae bacterium]|jgi:hypothetical protein|nr:hypothetical protein [Kangiellaceae bacterium]